MHLLGHLESDVAASDHHGATGMAVFDPLPDPFHIRDVPNGEMAGAINSGDGRRERRSAGGEHQGVVGLVVFALRGQVAHLDDLRFAVDGDDLGLDAHVEIESGAEGFRSLEQEGILFDNLAADEVGQSAIGEGDMRPAFEHDDFALFAEPTGAGGGAGATGHAAHDHQASRLHSAFMEPRGGRRLQRS